MAGEPGRQERIDAGTTWVGWDGEPFVDPTSGRRGAFMEEVLSLNEAQLVELCNYWEWRSERAEREIDQWWCWTVVRFARHVLGVRRGYHPHPGPAS